MYYINSKIFHGKSVLDWYTEVKPPSHKTKIDLHHLIQPQLDSDTTLCIPAHHLCNSPILFKLHNSL